MRISCLDFFFAICFTLSYYVSILFVTAAGEVLIYDAQGKQIKAMVLPEGAQITSVDGHNERSPRFAASEGKDDDSDDEGKDGEEKEGDSKGGGKVTSVDWYDETEGLLHPRVPTLCIALDGGIIQMSRGVEDPAPIVINTHMTIRKARMRKEQRRSNMCLPP